MGRKNHQWPGSFKTGFFMPKGWKKYRPKCRKYSILRLSKSHGVKKTVGIEPVPDRSDQPPAETVIEAVLFAASESVSRTKLLKRLKPFYKKGDITAAIETLKKRYDKKDSGVLLMESGGGYQLATKPEYYEQVSSVLGNKKMISLSPAGLEALSLIAYKQPVSKADIEAVRGVQSDGVIRSLIDLNLVKVVGRENNIGRAFLYGTTKKFLIHFGLKGIKDLPRVQA